MNVSLATRYLGLELKNPLVVSACPLTGNLETLAKLEAAGAAAVVLPSLFEEIIEHEVEEVARLYDYRETSSMQSPSDLPQLRRYNVGTEHYLLHLREAKKAIEIPVIASLNGTTPGGWTRYARRIEEAGADALELNVYFVPTDASVTATDVEQRYIDLVQSVRASISIPLAVKIGPYFSNVAYLARELVEAGADGLVLFNRYLHPDIDIDRMAVEPRVEFSTRDELWQSLRWIAIIHDQIQTSLAANSGIHFTEDVIKSLLAGADVAMMASVLLEHGPQHIGTLLAELEHWMRKSKFNSVDKFKGSLDRGHMPDASALERANYTKALASFVNPF